MLPHSNMMLLFGNHRRVAEEGSEELKIMKIPEPESVYGVACWKQKGAESIRAKEKMLKFQH
jgi:hypothetical protein